MRKNKAVYACFSVLGLGLLILDSRTAISGAAMAISQCIKTVIPSLFPFLLLSIYLTENLSGSSFRMMRPIAKLCGMPKGSEHILLIGLLGGYPTGAKSVFDAWNNKTLSTHDARHMLSFCSNAGPSLIFGIAGLCFHSVTIPLILWIIQIASAILTGFLLKKNTHSVMYKQASEDVSFVKSLDQAMRVMASVCGWIIVFRVIQSFFERWILFLLPNSAGIVLSGMLELTNGCLLLESMDHIPLRFILCSVFLSFGGVCVMFQTVNVIGNLGIDCYIRGKLLQTIISLMLSVSAASWLFPDIAGILFPKAAILLPITLLSVLIFIKIKFRSRFSAETIV